MPTVEVNGISLHYQESGAGTPLVLCHEYATDHRAWEPQIRHFARRYRVIAWNFRGYPPSSVPRAAADYEHGLFVSDLAGLLDLLGIERCHLVGIATGGNVALNFALEHPDRIGALVMVGAGAGTSDRENWLRDCARLADRIAAEGTRAAAESIGNAPQRTVFAAKDPRGWNEFLGRIRDLSPIGAEMLMRVALPGRLPVTALKARLHTLDRPVLVMMGDQDYPAHEAGRFVRDHAPHAGLTMLPMCGHTMNSEEPMLFNQLLGDFLAAVDAGRWGTWRSPPGGPSA